MTHKFEQFLHRGKTIISSCLSPKLAKEKLQFLFRNWRARTAFVIALLGMVLQLSGALHCISGKCALLASNNNYIKDSLTEVTAELVFVEASLTGLKLIQSTTTGASLGIDINFQVGQLVGFLERSVQDLSQIIEMSGIVLASLWGIEKAAHAITEFLFWALWIGLLFYALASLSLKASPLKLLAVKLNQCAITLILILYVTIPLSISTSAALSTHLLSDQKTESHQFFHTILSPIHPLSFQENDEESQSSQNRQTTDGNHTSDLFHHEKSEKQIAWIHDGLKQISGIDNQNRNRLTQHLRNLFAAYLLQTIIFPLLVFAVFHYTTRKLFSGYLNDFHSFEKHFKSIEDRISHREKT